MKRCVVNVAVESWYPRGQNRMRATLNNVGYDGDMLFWDSLPPGCPSHDDVPYGFKAFSLEMAQSRGYGPSLWCDSSTWFLRNPAPVFERIERDGYYLWRNPTEMIGQYAADNILPKFGVGREESFDIPFKEITQGRAQDFALLPGDIVFVAESAVK